MQLLFLFVIIFLVLLYRIDYPPSVGKIGAVVRLVSFTSPCHFSDGFEAVVTPMTLRSSRTNGTPCAGNVGIRSTE
jgi:hypothetical protein